ncbi:MAG: hypothetical protein LBU64_00520 [Planctomycetota bacterium]|jgi:hypothetical protein|nr:hypothetical protein [Planctomycetota bacterium]
MNHDGFARLAALALLFGWLEVVGAPAGEADAGKYILDEIPLPAFKLAFYDLVSAGEMEKAEKVAAMMRERDPDDPDTLNAHGHLALVKGDLDGAGAAWERLLAGAGGGDGTRGQGDCPGQPGAGTSCPGRSRTRRDYVQNGH